MTKITVENVQVCDLTGELSENEERVILTRKLVKKYAEKMNRLGERVEIDKKDVIFYSLEQGRVVFLRRTEGPSFSVDSLAGDFICAHDDNGATFHINKNFVV